MRYFGALLFWCVFFCWPHFSVSQSTNYVNDTLDLSTVVITAQFAPTDSREAVNSVRILNQKNIENRGAVNLQELLLTEANLRISQDQFFGSSLSINGLQAQNVKILVDGVPVVGRLGGSVDMGQLPLSSVRQVEIIEGAQSLIYGSSAAAGVVNLISKSSQVYQLEGQVTGLAESNGFQSLNARAGVDLGKLTLSLDGGALRFEPEAGDSTRSTFWNPKEQENLRALLSFSPNDDITIRASGSHFYEEVDDLGDVNRPQFKPYAFDQFFRTTRNNLTLHGEGWLPGNLYFQATAGYNDFDRKRNNYRTELRPDTSFMVMDGIDTFQVNFEPDTSFLLMEDQDTSKASGLLFRATLASDRKDRNWDWLAGFDAYRETASGGRIVDTSGSVVNTEYGLFGSIKYRFGKSLIVQAGARGIHNELFGSALTPSIWTAYRPTKNWEFKASYADGFRSPVLQELYFEFIDINHFIIGNLDLGPERSDNYRVELNRKNIGWPDTKWLNKKWLPKKLSFNLSAAFFYNKVENRIVLAEFEPLRFTYRNISEWRTMGYSISADLIKRRRFKLRSTLVRTGFYETLSSTRDVDDLVWSYDWANDLSVDFFKGKAGFNFWHKWTGDTPDFFLEDDEVVEGIREGWQLFNASVNAKFFDRKIQVTTGVKNIADVRQIRTGGNNGGAHSGSSTSHPVHWGRTFFIQAKFFIHSKK